MLSAGNIQKCLIIGSMPRDIQEATQQYYNDYYDQKGRDRNSIRLNPGVLFQVLAMESSVIRVMRECPIVPGKAKLLDVGCGAANNWFQLTRLGFELHNLSGIDIFAERLADAKTLYPQATFIHGDASKMNFADNSFDLLFEFTMFATLPDDELSASIAREMLRVCKPGGHILLIDWRTPRPKTFTYKALTRRRVNSLFRVGTETELIAVCRGALVPPVGRFLSAYLPSVYFLVAALFPFLVGQVAYLLVKKQR